MAKTPWLHVVFQVSRSTPDEGREKVQSTAHSPPPGAGSDAWAGALSVGARIKRTVARTRRNLRTKSHPIFRRGIILCDPVVTRCPAPDPTARCPRVVVPPHRSGPTRG